MPDTADSIAASCGRARSGLGLGIGFACLLGSFGCADEYEPVVFTVSEWEKIEGLSSLPAPPPDPTNAWADDADAARLGQRLFFDKGYGGWFDDEPANCATCHEPNDGFVTHHEEGEFRNTTTVVNAVYYEWFTWDGHRDSLWSLPLVPVENPDMLNTTRLDVAHRIAAAYADDYVEVFGDVFGDQLQQFVDRKLPLSGKPGQDAWDNLSDSDKELVNRIFANFGKALAAYMRLVVTPDSRFDDFVADGPDSDLLEESEKRGLRLFVGHANCIACHAGPAMTDNQFHNIGLVTDGRDEKKRGRTRGIERLLAGEFHEDSPYSDGSTNRLADLAAEPEDEYAFRTPSLRNVAKKKHWMHTPGFTDLEQVIRHYNDPSDGRGERSKDIKGLGLTRAEIRDLEALLKTFSSRDDAVDPALKMDTSAR